MPMKPFFTNPFAPFFTRTGTPIGKASERTMLQAAGGPNTIRKRFQTNPDGSTTMLHTQNGLARFSRFSTTGQRLTANDFTITNGLFFVSDGTMGCFGQHTFHHEPQTWSGEFRMWLVNKLGLPNLRITSLTGGFTISGDVVTTPLDCLWYPEYVYVECDAWPAAYDHLGEIAYEIHIGPSRRNNPDVFGVGTSAGT